MKARLARFVGMFLLLSSIFFHPTLLLHAAPWQQDELSSGEPNNTFGSAGPITVGSPIEGTIASAGDADWYAFDVDQQGELQIAITNVAEDLALVARVWNGEKATVSGWIAPLAAGGDTEGVVDLVQPGRYFLEIADNNGNVESEEPYSLLIDFTPTLDVDEPNNSFGRSAAIPLGEAFQGNILPAGDVDWYSFEVPGHGELNAAIRDVSDELAVSYRLWNSNRETISGWISPLARGGETIGSLDIASAGKYYLEVAAESGERSTQPYTMQVDFTAAVDSSEPNNYFGQAAILPFGESIVANILPSGDADWYQISVPHHGELTIAVTDVPENLAVQVRVWNSDKETLTGWFSPLAAGGKTNAVVDLPLAGNYFIEFADANSKRSIEPFTVTVSFIEAIDPNEGNNSFGSATVLPVGQSLQSNIIPAGDRDWYQISVPHHGELQITASDVPENLDINFRLWNSNADTISGWFTPLARGGNTTGVVDLPSAGSYLIEVANGSSDGRSVEPFTLQTLFLPAADQGEPNNSFETATVAALDTNIPGNILPAGDTDWYSVEVGEGGDLHVLVTNVAPNMQMVFRLWNADEAVVNDWVYPLAAGGNTEAVIPIAEPGTYFLEVADNRSARSIQPYLLRFSMDEIDPADMTFMQTLVNTDTVTDTVSTVEEGTETITTTTTVVTTTITMETSAEVAGSETITATDALSNTSVMTRPASTSTPPRTPTTPSVGAAKGESEDNANETIPEVRDSTSITETSEITDTAPTTATGIVPPPTAQTGSSVANAMEDAVIPEGEVVRVEGIDVVQPTGWQSVSDTGPFRGVALNPDDLTAEAPQGPRLWVLSPGVEDLQFSGTLEPVGEETQVVEEPSTFEIGEHTATAIAVQETVGGQSVIRRYVFVNTGEGESYEFILESPAAQWEDQVALLEGILASMLIQPE